MSCPHAATTTVAFLYGEAADAHALHVAGCPECEAVVTEHEQVATALASTLPALRRAPARPLPRVLVGGLVMAMAAAALLVVQASRVPDPAPADAVPDGFDVAVDELDLELTTFELELL